MDIGLTLLKNLLEFATKRLSEGIGLDALCAFNADHPELVQAYSIGYLPPGFKSLLDAESRRALISCRIANALILPAFDELGAPVDLLAVHPNSKGKTYVNLADEPRGLIAPAVSTAFETLILTDSFPIAAAMFRAGQKNILFVRGIADVRNNAQRLRTSGVSAIQAIVRRDIDEIISALVSTGIKVQREKFPKKFSEAASPSSSGDIPDVPCEISNHSAARVIPINTEIPLPDYPAIRLQTFDYKTGQAIFRAADVTYSAIFEFSGQSTLEIKVERDGRIHTDRFDLQIEAQRKRFSSSAALRIDLHPHQIEHQLLELLSGIKALPIESIEPNKSSSACVSELEKLETLSFLEKADLLQSIACDFEIFGWVGDEKIKKLLYLMAVSRKLDHPLSGMLNSVGDVDVMYTLDAIAAFTPPEDLIHCSRLTVAAFYYQQPDALRHKLLVLDDASLLTAEVRTTLRILQTRGAISQSHVLRDPTTGLGTTHFHEAHGPLAILTSSTKDLKPSTLDRCLEISLDESIAQTDRILALQRRLRSDPEQQGAIGRKSTIIKRHIAIQRLLQCKRVVIPFADRIQFPSLSVRYRRDQDIFLTLIEASALLNQYRRSTKKNSSGDEFILADIEDYEIARDLLSAFIAKATDDLSAHAHGVLDLILEKGLTTFALDDLKTLRPDWTRYKFRSGISELLKLEVLISPSAGRGKIRQYRLHAQAAASLRSVPVRLLSGHEISDLATVSGSDFANCTSASATG